MDNCVLLPARVTWNTTISWPKVNETRRRPLLQPAGSNSDWSTRCDGRDSHLQNRVAPFTKHLAESSPECCVTSVEKVWEIIHLVRQVTSFPTQRQRESICSHFLCRWRGSALDICIPLHSCISQASCDKLSFSCSDPLFSFSYGEQWVQCPDPQGEMRLRALPWKPCPCFSNQHVRTGNLLNSFTEWTKNNRAHQQLFTAKGTHLCSSNFSVHFLNYMHNMLWCLQGFQGMGGSVNSLIKLFYEFRCSSSCQTKCISSQCSILVYEGNFFCVTALSINLYKWIFKLCVETQLLSRCSSCSFQLCPLHIITIRTKCPRKEGGLWCHV